MVESAETAQAQEQLESRRAGERMRVAYVVSAKSGLPAWNYREIDILIRNGVDIGLYVTKWNTGKHMPKPEWHVRRPEMVRALLSQPAALLRGPVSYCRLLLLALSTRTLVEFVLAADFARDMRLRAVQHIHCHFGDRKLFTGYYCSQMLGVSLSVTVHAYEILMNPNPAMFRLATEACDTVVVQSEFNRSEIVRLYGVDPRKIRVIRAHGDVSDERMRLSTKLLIAAEFTEKKGHEVLFKALRELGRDDITLWVVGKGKLDVPGMAEDLGVSDRTVFLGAVDSKLMGILMDACDVFVHPSRTTATGDREGIPAVIMEAMSHHKPVITTRHAGIPELVPQILVDENDVDGLAEAIARLVDSPGLRHEMGERNYEIIKSEFSENAVLQLMDVYQRSIDSDNHPHAV